MYALGMRRVWQVASLAWALCGAGWAQDREQKIAELGTCSLRAAK
ncbi:hypothetical protein [Edaphobacter aggregans]|nr:hypothetical protein [Edaphobacter aggregans]